VELGGALLLCARRLGADSGVGFSGWVGSSEWSGCVGEMWRQGVGRGGTVLLRAASFWAFGRVISPRVLFWGRRLDLAGQRADEPEDAVEAAHVLFGRKSSQSHARLGVAASQKAQRSSLIPASQPTDSGPAQQL
jgi:hypothetical protein